MPGPIDRVKRILREPLSGLCVIHAFVRDACGRQRFAAANDAMTDTALHTGRLMAAMIPMAVLVMRWSTTRWYRLCGHAEQHRSARIGWLRAAVFGANDQRPAWCRAWRRPARTIARCC